MHKEKKKQGKQKLDHIFHVMYTLCKVRGFKVISKFFPCKPEDFRSILKCFRGENMEDNETWESRYILLLWLSMAVLIPFDFWRLEYSEKEKENSKILEIMIQDFLPCLQKLGKVSEGASVFLSKLIVRPDVSQSFREDFLTSLVSKLNSEKQGSNFTVNISYKNCHLPA